MATSELQVDLRETLGKGGARKLRAADLVPAIVYGKGDEPCPVTVAPKALQKAIATEAGWNTLITLKGDGPFDGKVVILKEMTSHPIKGYPTHVDFQTINMSEKVHVMVPVHAIGTAEGVKMGGNLQVIRKELEVHCLPSAIPSSIDIDVTELMIGNVVHIDDVTLPEGAEVPHDVNFTVITVAGHKGEDEEEGVEGEDEEGTEEDAE